jgi:hypothetical protein
MGWDYKEIGHFNAWNENWLIEHMERSLCGVWVSRVGFLEWVIS